MSDGFLNRWSRLKSESKDRPAPPPAAPEAAAAPVETVTEIPPELPPIDSLTKESNFSAFLQAGVPEDLRRAALSKLWSSDPMFTQPEVFDLHMEDYNAHPLGEVVKTAWKLGKGVVDDLITTDDSASFPDLPEKTHIKTSVEDDDPLAS